MARGSNIASNSIASKCDILFLYHDPFSPSLHLKHSLCSMYHILHEISVAFSNAVQYNELIGYNYIMLDN